MTNLLNDLCSFKAFKVKDKRAVEAIGLRYMTIKTYFHDVHYEFLFIYLDIWDQHVDG